MERNKLDAAAGELGVRCLESPLCMGWLLHPFHPHAQAWFSPIAKQSIYNRTKVQKQTCMRRMMTLCVTLVQCNAEEKRLPFQR